MADDYSDQRVVEAWRINARPWISAVRGERIESRKLVTNGAVIAAVLGRDPKTVLDIGCGEGWLARALADEHIDVIGVDAVSELIEQARHAGGGKFRVLSYEEIAAGKLDIKVDVAVANFSLIGSESVNVLVARVPALLNEGGALIIQTLHPATAGGDAPYADGWRPGSWAGIDEEFADPAPWYFRTLESWIELITTSGFNTPEIWEPLNPDSGLPASAIFIAEPIERER